MIQRLQRRLREHPRTVDVAVAASVFACSFPGSVLTLPGRHPEVPWWPGVLLAGVSCTALLWHRSRPRTTVTLTIVCAMAVTALGYVLTVLLLGPLMVALHSLAIRTDRRTANTFTFTGIALLVGTALTVGPSDEPLAFKLIGPAAWLLLPTSLGTASRLRGAYLEAVQARADHAERTREEEARHRVTEERMRIARDLHDVVAHHVLLANIQAGAVARLLRTRPDEAERIVGELIGTTASGIRELKATVGLLRGADDQDQPADAPPGLARLPELAASFNAAGLDVTVTSEGQPHPLSPGADLTAYRIVQEALTNVTKHATATSAEVRLAYSDDRVGITVTNGGRPALPSTTAPDSGYGLIGMRERVRSVGGHLRVGPCPEGGYEVATELPLRPHGLESAAVR
ncbi:sensor histidine kinase [Streptomyces sp. NPDC087903]|uniref:sensor histidine kinase n=1 Tax=Streptomyces sp. NPDC087903 TaxID=3365819 RepID=UPI003820BD4B